MMKRRTMYSRMTLWFLQGAEQFAIHLIFISYNMLRHWLTLIKIPMFIIKKVQHISQKSEDEDRMIFLCIHYITNENSRKMFIIIIIIIPGVHLQCYYNEIIYNFRFQFTIFIMRQKSFHSPEWRTSLVKSWFSSGDKMQYERKKVSCTRGVRGVIIFAVIKSCLRSILNGFLKKRPQ